jgi:hypothetical protein
VGSSGRSRDASLLFETGSCRQAFPENRLAFPTTRQEKCLSHIHPYPQFAATPFPAERQHNIPIGNEGIRIFVFLLTHKYVSYFCSNPGNTDKPTGAGASNFLILHSPA